MSSWHRAGVFLIVAAVAGVAGFYFNRSSPVSAVADGATERLLQGFLPDLNGNPQTFAQWKGKVLVLNFWATWCSPCRDEIPELMKVQRKYAANGVQIVGIALDNVGNVQNFARDMGINYALLLGDMDTLNLAKDLGNRAGVLPFTIVLDRTGGLVHAHTGAVTEASLSALLTPLL